MLSLLKEFTCVCACASAWGVCGVYGCFASKFFCAPCSYSAQGSQERASGILGLKLQMVLSYPVGAEN